MYPDAELSEAEQAVQSRLAPESPPGLMESSGEEASLAGSSPRAHAHVPLGVRQRVASCSDMGCFWLGALTQIMDIKEIFSVPINLGQHRQTLYSTHCSGMGCPCRPPSTAEEPRCLHLCVSRKDVEADQQALRVSFNVFVADPQAHRCEHLDAVG